MTQQVKNLLAMQKTQETWVQSLGLEVPIKEERVTHFSILAWESSWTEELLSYSPKGFKELDMTERLSTVYKY